MFQTYRIACSWGRASSKSLAGAQITVRKFSVFDAELVLIVCAFLGHQLLEVSIRSLITVIAPQVDYINLGRSTMRFRGQEEELDSTQDHYRGSMLCKGQRHFIRRQQQWFADLPSQ